MGGVSNESAPPYSRAITLGTIQNRLSITETKISSLETFCLPPRRGMQSSEAPLMCVQRSIDAPPWLQESPSTSATQQFPWYFLFCFLKQTKSTKRQHRKESYFEMLQGRAGKKHVMQGHY